jgi:bifunctional non-homologous end joining protein LigD
VLDGEVVLLDPSGRPSFQQLQRRMHIADLTVARALARSMPVSLMLFDVMWLDGADLRPAPYDERRAALESLGIESPHVHVPVAQRGDPTALVDFCRAHGLEGVVAKRRASPYRSGRRSPDWIKHKLFAEQELVVVGWTPGERARASSFGSLLLGRHATPGGPLIYAGRVGSGFRDDELRRWTELLRAHERSEPTVVSPFAPRNAHWVDPVLVVQVRFTEWTEEGVVRHSTYRGQRDDIDPESVTGELPA